MCAREDVDYHGQEIKSRLAEIESKLECFDKKLDAVVAMLAKYGAEKTNRDDPRIR